LVNHIRILEDALRGEKPEKIPTIPLLGVVSLDHVPYSIEEVYKNPNLMVKSLTKMARVLHVDGITPFMDLTVEAEALGCPVNLSSQGRSIKEHIYQSSLPSDLNWELSNVMVYYQRVLESLKKSLSNLPVIGYVTGPYTVLSQLISPTSLVVLLMRDEENSIPPVIYSLCKLIEEYIEILSEAEPDALMILEPVGCFFNPTVFREYFSDPLRSISNYIRKMGVYPLLHICGDSSSIVGEMAKTGYLSLSLDSPVDLKEAKKYGCSVWGNLDTGLLLEASPQEIEAKTLDLLERTKGTGHILSSGCDVRPGTSPENIYAMVKGAEKFSSHLHH